MIKIHLIEWSNLSVFNISELNMILARLVELELYEQCAMVRDLIKEKQCYIQSQQQD
jgi:protein-arginine kinase activator protein McsA